MTLRAAGAVLIVAIAGCGGAAPEPAQSPAPAATAGLEQLVGQAVGASDQDGDSAPDQQTGEARPWLGVALASVPPGEAGVAVRDVVRGSPAAALGIATGDRILSVDGENVQTPGDVIERVRRHAVGSRLSLGVRRGEQDRLLAVTLTRMPSQDGIMRMSYVGAPAPTLESLQTAQGSITPTLAALRGKVVVLEFWATWCAVCQVLVPTMNEWHQRYAGQGVELLGVTTEPVERAAQGASQLGITYPVASDESGHTSEAYGALALPTLFVIDRKGTVRDVMVGYSSPRLGQLQALLDWLVSEP